MIDAVVIDQTYQLKDIDLIDPSPLNPRKTFDQARLAELAASIKEAGVIEPLVVRPGKKDRVELVAGERRWRAAKLVGLTDLPIVIRSLSDMQVLTLMAIENEQRDDIHPLERAAGYQALMKADATFTPESIAKRIGKSKRWVQLCLQYLTLIPEAQKAFREGTITPGHADLVVRLKPEDQKRALGACFVNEQEYGFFELGEGPTPVAVLVSVRDLDHWIRQNIRLPLDASSPQLEFLPEVKDAIEAANPVFHKDAARLLELVDSHWIDDKIKPAPLTRKYWTFVKKGDKCAAPQRGVIVYGATRGRVVNICTGVGVCATHWPTTVERQKAPATHTPTPQRKKSAAEIKRDQAEAAAMARERVEAQAWTAVRVKALALAKAKAMTLKPGPVAYTIVATALHECGVFNIPRAPKTLGQLLGGLLDDASHDVDQFREDIARPLGIDLKPLFAAAAPKTEKKPAAKKKPAREFLRKDASPGARKALAKRPKLGKGK